MGFEQPCIVNGSGRRPVSGACEARYQGLSRPGLSPRGVAGSGTCPWLALLLVGGLGLPGVWRNKVSGPFEARAVPRMGGRSLRDLSLLHTLAFFRVQSIDHKLCSAYDLHFLFIELLGRRPRKQPPAAHRPARPVYYLLFLCLAGCKYCVLVFEVLRPPV